MPPTIQRRRNPVADARSAFLEEAPEPYYFPDPRRYDFGGGSFDPVAGIGLQAADTLAAEDLFSRRDDDATKAGENIHRRLLSASRRRLMPYSEAAQRAQMQRSAAEDEAEIPGIPRRIEQRDELADLRLGQEREDLDYRTERLRALQEADPYMDRLQRMHGATPEDLFAYQQLSEMGPPELTPRQRREWARDNTLGLMRDREAVAAADFLANDVDEAGKPRDATAFDLIETVADPSGRLIGQRIKAGADPKRVSEMILNYRRHQRQRGEREKRLKEDSAYYNQDLDNTRALMGAAEREQAAYVEARQAVPKEVSDRLMALRRRTSQLNDELRKLRGLPPLPSLELPEAPAPAPAPKAEEKKESAAAPAGKAANVADFYKTKSAK